MNDPRNISVIFRNPGEITQSSEKTEWGELDLLLVDQSQPELKQLPTICGQWFELPIQCVFLLLAR